MCSVLFPRWLAPIAEPRNVEAPNFTYPLKAILFQALFMFVGRLGARRQMEFLLRTDAAAKTFNTVFGVPKVAHGDTVNNVLCALDPAQVQEVVSSMTETLIRKKMLCAQRLLDTHYCIAIDGTGTAAYRERHCPHCLTRTHNDKTTYYHNVLEAKLVTPNGFAFSIMSEFIENSDPNASKQDCELKAFYRLAPRLKERFPKLSLALLLDGLFACGPVFEICRGNAWKFIINLKDDCLPSVNEEFHTLCELNPGNRLIVSTGAKETIRQLLRWSNDIDYVDTKKRAHTLSVFECQETKPAKNGQGKTTTFRWVTNFIVKDTNVFPLANQGGRLRWKIENEGFNIQKTGGYELEHAYTQDEQGMKVYYFILQMACIIQQLIDKGSLLRKAFPKGFGSAKNLAWRLLEDWRNRPVSPEHYRRLCQTKIQIRFDTS